MRPHFLYKGLFHRRVPSLLSSLAPQLPSTPVRTPHLHLHRESNHGIIAAIHTIRNLPQLSNTGWDGSNALTMGCDNPNAMSDLLPTLSPV